MVTRNIINKIRQIATKFPVVALTGTRQCGKSTLLKNCFPDYRFISLEDLDIRQYALSDPRGFLSNFGDQLIIDEAQYAPQLFSYIQTKVDDKNESGMYILSGSHNFLLMENISQSLAGRCAILTLAPFSISEMKAASLLPDDLNTWLYKGGYPRIYDKDIDPTDFFPNYLRTYIERDVRLLRNIGDVTLFAKFLKMCAARVGQLLNISSLANECGISAETANSWISVLETSYVAFMLRPYHKNFNKRLVKSPKMYFYDSGLVCSLLEIANSDQLSTHYLRGEIFENMIVSETFKRFWFQGKEPNISFWRDSNQNEVDLLIETNGQLSAYEIKSGATMNSDFFSGLKTFRRIADLPVEQCFVVYGGDLEVQTTDGKYLSWRNW